MENVPYVFPACYDSPLALKGNSPVRETPLIREMSRSDRGFAVFARKNVGFADKRVAAPAKGEVETEGFDRGDYPLINRTSIQKNHPKILVNPQVVVFIL